MRARRSWTASCPVAPLGVLVVLGLLRHAGAHSLTAELTAGGTEATPTAPSSAFVTSRLSAAFELGRDHAWTLRPRFQYTHDFATPTPPGVNFSSSPGDIYFLSLELARELGPRVELGLELNGSPPSVSTSDLPVPYTARVARQTVDLTADGALRSETSNVGGTLWLSYSSPPSERIEVEADLSFGATELFLDNQLTELWSAKQGQAVSVDTVRAGCASRTGRACSATLLAALDGQSAQLFAGKLAASVTTIIRRHTDVTIGGSYTFYDRDPTLVGYTAATARGRTATPDSAIGGGLPIAPSLFTLSAGVTRRVRELTLGLSFQFIDYVSDGAFSYGLSVGARVQYRVHPRLQLWIKASGQRDVDAANTISYSGFLTVGGRVSFGRRAP